MRKQAFGGIKSGSGGQRQLSIFKISLPIYNFIKRSCL
ncbi:uncharacterized protein METZ01_LOCUS211063 [marine metagenome]|uniref:Uncharacterized protein n=1 Tax=marine metagenome TaxID=408172 RepID=A0A382F6A6_9ZZZZ